ncbi:conserved hypothetical protein [Ricinus communis]|uniref:Membrane protein insertion efficiency factor YidD n=1 Tax=Ricinus communis TaxID=3988 RepID=B9TDU0_RICCO|nr:conserved hypothetical protein [Ricinus communis]
MLRPVALLLIRGYRRYLSPRKGFSCAYRVHRGGHSCSAHGYHAISKHGFFLGMQLLRRRLDRCAWANHMQRSAKAASVEAVVASRMMAQGGFVDGCDAGSCDAPDCGGPACSLDCSSPDCSPHRLSCDALNVMGACDGSMLANADCDDCDGYFDFGKDSSGKSEAASREEARRAARALRRGAQGATSGRNVAERAPEGEETRMSNQSERTALSWPQVTIAPINLWSFPAAWKTSTPGQALAYSGITVGTENFSPRTELPYQRGT